MTSRTSLEERRWEGQKVDGQADLLDDRLHGQRRPSPRYLNADGRSQLHGSLCCPCQALLWCQASWLQHTSCLQLRSDTCNQTGTR